MNFFLSLALVAIMVSSSPSAAEPLAAVSSSGIDATSLTEPGGKVDVTMLPTLSSVTSGGMSSDSGTLNVSATKVPESAAAGFVALIGFMLMLRRRPV